MVRSKLRLVLGCAGFGLALVLAREAQAQAPRGVPGHEASVTMVFTETATGAPQIPVEGECDYPNGTIFYLTLRLAEEESAHIDSKRVIASNGRFQTQFGPYERRILRGRYVIDLWFNMDNQPSELRRTFRTEWGLTQDFREIVSSQEREFGTAEEAAEDDVMIRTEVERHLATIRAEAQAILPEVARVIAERSGVRSDAFMPFGEEHYNRMNAIRDELAAWQGQFLGLRKLDWLRSIESLTHTLTNLMLSALHQLRAREGASLTADERRLADGYEEQLAAWESELRRLDAELQGSHRGDPSTMPGGGTPRRP